MAPIALAIVLALLVGCSASPPPSTPAETEVPVVDVTDCDGADCSAATPTASDVDEGDVDTATVDDSEEPAADDAGERAREAYRLGAAAYKSGDYGAAQRHFQEAYRLDPRDVLLFNLAQATLKQGAQSAACRYYRRWKATPTGRSGPSIQELAATCP